MASKIEKAPNGDIIITIPATEVLNLNPDLLGQTDQDGGTRQPTWTQVGPQFAPQDSIKDVGDFAASPWIEVGPRDKGKINFDKIKK